MKAGDDRAATGDVMLNGRRLFTRGRDRRVGRRHRQIMRLLITADGGPVTTRQMVEFVYPWLDPSKPIARWRWRKVRLSAERYAERVTPRDAAAALESQALADVLAPRC